MAATIATITPVDKEELLEVELSVDELVHELLPAEAVVPLAQLLHTLRPVDAAYVLSEQAVHIDSPEEAAIVPATHAVHND